MEVTEKKSQGKLSIRQQRLTGFFVLVVGTSVILLLYILLFGSVIFFKYQNVNQLIPIFRNYYQQMSDSMDSLDDYVVNEDEMAYDNAVSTLALAQQSLADLSEKVNDRTVLRSIEDLGALNDAMEEQMKQIQKCMEAYQNNTDIAFDQVTDSYEQVDFITAVQDEYNPMIDLLFDYMEWVNERIKETCLASILLILFGIIISGVLIFIQIKNIYVSFANPVERMIYAAGEVEKEHYDNAVNSVESIDSTFDQGMLLLVKSFSQMIVQVRRQISLLKENAVIQKQLQEAKFKELQMQINPHFMFNTLNMISNFALLEQADKTALLLNKTAKMFRFSLDFSGKTVPLYKEVKELENYIFIQEQRYGNRIQFIWNLPDVLPELSIPALTLQPLIENSIVHGIGLLTSGAKIEISIIEEIRGTYHDCKITVSDNGAGMTQKQLEKLRTEIESYSVQNAKIGLGNVYLRLKMLWKEQVSMDIESEVEKGTKISIVISREKEGGLCIN